MSEVTIAELEDQLKETKIVTRRMDQAERLAVNKDFKDLILNSFCIEECARYARESANPGLSLDDRANALAMAQAAGHLKRFLQVTVMQGRTMEKTAKAIEDEIAEMRAEGAAE